MAGLRRSDLDPDPLAQFAGWFVAAGSPEPVALATASADGVPSARMVLLKGFDPRGYVFYTGYDSRKGRELEENPRASLLFYWPEPGRQVRIGGRVERVEEAVSDGYWASRPLPSRLSAAAGYVLVNPITFIAPACAD